jgi:enoyl-CoA hydratase
MTFRYDLPPEIQIELDGPIRVIRLNRPDDLNAANDPLHRGLAAVWRQLAQDPDARAAVITGNGRAFCAGGRCSWTRRRSSRG